LLRICPKIRCTYLYEQLKKGFVAYPGEARHGGHQARTGHRAAGEGGDRGAARIRRSTGGAHAQTEAKTFRTSL